MNPERDDIPKGVRKDREGVLRNKHADVRDQEKIGGGERVGPARRPRRKTRKEGERSQETDVPAIKRSWEYKERYVKLDCGVELWKHWLELMWSKSRLESQRDNKGDEALRQPI